MSIFWLCLCLFIQLSWCSPIPDNARHQQGHKIGRVVESDNFIRKQRPHSREQMENIHQISRADRLSNEQDILKYHRSQCNYNQHWTHWQGSAANPNLTSVYAVKFYTGPLRPMYPQKNLIQYMSMIYRCCKLGFSCRRTRGLQGTSDEGGREAYFYINSEIYDLQLQRAELHLQISSDEQVTVIPVLNFNGLRRSSFTERNGLTKDLALDVMFIFEALEERAMTDTVNENVTELSVSLHCIHNNLYVPCNLHKVSLLQSPFITLQASNTPRT